MAWIGISRLLSREHEQSQHRPVSEVLIDVLMSEQLHACCNEHLNSIDYYTLSAEHNIGCFFTSGVTGVVRGVEGANCPWR